AGNQSAAASLTLTLEVDATAPTLTLAEDTGSSATGGITSEATVLVGNLGAEATWEYSLDNGDTWQDGTGNSFTLPADGSYALQVRQTEAGSTSGVATLDVTLDTSAPAAASFA